MLQLAPAHNPLGTAVIVGLSGMGSDLLIQAAAGSRNPFLLSYAAVAATSLFVGFRAGIVCAATCGVAAAFSLLVRRQMHGTLDSVILLELALFLAIMPLIVAFVHWLEHAHATGAARLVQPLRLHDVSASFARFDQERFQFDDRHDLPRRHFVSRPEPEHTAPPPMDRDASLATLAIGLGHDIGNIVLPILCHLDSLEAQNLPDSARRDLRAVRESAMHLKRLSGGLSFFGHDPQDPNATLPFTDLQAWWSEIEPILRKSLSPKVSLLSEFPADLPAARIPPHQLTRAMLNLVSNSVESIAEGGEVRISCHVSPDAETIRIAVTDSGCGMSDDVRRKAMNPFFTTKTRGLSTGLGLSQVNNMVKAAGGSVTIDSQLYVGTTITLTLPATRGGSNADLRSAQVDLHDQRTASYARALLECCGFAVHTNGSGETDDSLLISEPARLTLDSARRFVRSRRGRRIIIVGGSAEDWRDPCILVVDGSHRAMQRALQRAVRDMA